MYSAQRLASRTYAVSEAIGDATRYYKAPANGFVYDIGLETTTTWAGATNKLIVEVGTSADHDLYAELHSGAAAAGTAMSARYSATADDTILHETTNKFNKGDTVYVTITAPAGSGEAGVGVVTVDFCLEA